LKSGNYMSRIGQKEIVLPSGVTASITEKSVTVKGPKGELGLNLPRGIMIEQKENLLLVRPKKQTGELKALWGTIRSLLANMVTGVSEGFVKKLEIHGVGYRAAAKGEMLELQVGFSHPVEIRAPKGIDFAVEKNVITVSGADKAMVGEMAAQIRKVKKPEPYKGKGIRYEGEHVRRKAGKKAATGE